MNQVITDGLVLMPPAFSEGLGVWSRGDGTPGSDTWATAPNAALVPADPDFGDCLEILKTDSVTQLRYMGQTPILPGTYLRITARVKVLSGNLPTMRVAAWAGDAAEAAVTGIPLTGSEQTFTAYGEILTASAIVGSGTRGGVDMPWGDAPDYGHFGLDFTGPNSGQIRIESLKVEDVTSVFHRKMMDWVDVRDFGALGDGVTDDRAAFFAADAAAAGREVLVPAGAFLISGNLTMRNPVRFEGKLVMPDGARLALNQNFDLNGYAEAFGDDVLGLKKGLQQLFNQSDFEAFDLCGRRVLLDAPIDVQGVVGNKNTYANRRVIRNGQLSAEDSSAWNDEVHSRSANWVNTDATTLTGVANAGDIPVGALVQGPQGVGREVYVTGVNAAQEKVYLSSPLWGAPAQQSYTFTRFKYLLDFSGFLNLQRFVVSDIEFLCAGRCSALMLPRDGLVFQVQDCFFTGPKDRGITSCDEGCQGMQIDRCQFLSNEQTARVQDRVSIAFNTNSSDVKIRDNRAVKFLHFAVMGGTGNIVTGNHFFQGDNETDGVRSPGIVITGTNSKMTFTGNYVDNCYIEWGNEHDPNPDMVGEYSFHGLTVNSNIFFATGAAPWMKFIVIKPYGADHYINGLSVCDNLFKKTGGAALEAVEGVDDSIAPLDTGRATDLLFTGNTFHGIVKRTENPVIRRHTEAAPASVWEIDLSDVLPFGMQAMSALSVLPEGAVRSVANVAIYTMPYATTRHGVGRQTIRLNWSQDLKGTVNLTARCDS
ncbi:right-handed parallel beta-helix repeat-containing protein [Roseibacterium beibuensis]|uniref:Glycosyl hydrolase family 28-related protein n=1 Tax=[Roseibacterium] beibuensis TaxID=1193142 RepID=A0ABP9LI21_9RHOB|nr:right-handed parallel beta-helix repeat-containing protein [Roseibacterium beibuensis]MCS6623624.1 right-handed parallel beta-helix repeat-containing protein [Roseibacterium beibuensis]